MNALVVIRSVARVLILGLVVCSCGSRLDCTTVHTGSFLHQNAAGVVDTRIMRTGDRQTEEYPEAGATCVFAVTWLTDCQYRLERVSGDAGCYTALPDSEAVVVTIESMTADEVTIRSQIERTGYETRGRLIRLRD